MLLAPPGWEVEESLATTPLTLTFVVRSGARTAIVRRLAPRVLGEPWALEAFALEASLLGRLGGRVTPRLLEQGEDGRGPYHVQERLPWPTLHRLAGAQAPAAAGPLVSACFDALAALHAEGVMHGDVAPGNVLVGRGAEEARLVDLVLARPFGARPPAGVQGTLAYMAPEAAREAPAAPASDVFAMAATLLELFGGGPPREGSPAERLLAAGEASLEAWGRAAAAALSPALADVLVGCLAPDPQERPSAAEAAEAGRARR